MKLGDIIEVAQPDRSNFIQKIEKMFDESGQPIEVAPHPQQLVMMPLRMPAAEFSMLRRKAN
jgi:putative protease